MIKMPYLKGEVSEGNIEENVPSQPWKSCQTEDVCAILMPLICSTYYCRFKAVIDEYKVTQSGSKTSCFCISDDAPDDIVKLLK